MNLGQFVSKSDMTKLREVDKVCHLAFFYLKTKDIDDFSGAEAAYWLENAGFAKPNQSRLEQNLRASRNTVRAPKGFKLSIGHLQDLEKKFPELNQKSQDVIEYGTIIPEIDYTKTRGYIESLAKQINAAYEHNLFDACAVLMRRLVEILLILSYRKLGIESAIQDSQGNYLLLDGISKDARNNTALNLSRNSKSSLETFRELGNFSAHKIEYICRREYIQPEIQKYRALIGELFHKSGLRT